MYDESLNKSRLNMGDIKLVKIVLFLNFSGDMHGIISENKTAGNENV